MNLPADRLRRPTFLIIGAQKAGTTALSHVLKQHRQVFMSPVKEPNYFARAEAALDRRPGKPAPLYEQDWVSYLRLFEAATVEPAVGEASPSYLYSAKAAQEIRERLPEVRLLAILRDPVQRAYSNYLHCVRRGVEPLNSFEQALAAEPDRIASGWGSKWHYRTRGLYAEQLARFRTFFPEAQMKVMIYERFREEPDAFVRDVYSFLGVDPEFRPRLDAQHNVSGVARSPLFRPILAAMDPYLPRLKRFVPDAGRSLFRRALLTRPQLSREVAAELRRSFAPDIRRLRYEFGLDIEHWLGAEL